MEEIIWKKCKRSWNDSLFLLLQKLIVKDMLLQVEMLLLYHSRFTMAGSMVLLINYVFLDPTGFVASLLHLGDLIPNLADYQAVFEFCY